MALFRMLWQMIRHRNFPQLLQKQPDGTVSGKCPKCKAPISYSPLAKGEQAFECPQCSQVGHWT